MSADVRAASPGAEGAAFGNRFTRRDFLKSSAAILAAAAAAPILSSRTFAAPRATAVEARYYEKLSGNRVRCLLCPRGCVVAEGKRGHCEVRENRGGTYYTLVHGHPCSVHIDPIEKKPFFHVLPGTQAFSLATVGCNIDCKFCQNWQISQARPEDAETSPMSPEEVIAEAVARATPSIAYTYAEPIIFIEYVQDIARLARPRGVRSVVVSNGFIERQPLLDLCGMVDAIKIDLKAFEDSYYREVCDGRLQPVLDTIQTIRSRGVWLELVYLVVPTLNDKPEKIREMARWVRSTVGPDVPLHFSRFFPQYRLANLPPTPVSTLDRAHEISRAEGLRYVYVGNVPGHAAEHTYCPRCAKRVVTRDGYRLARLDVVKGACRFCGEPIPGLWGET